MMATASIYGLRTMMAGDFTSASWLASEEFPSLVLTRILHLVSLSVVLLEHQLEVG